MDVKTEMNIAGVLELFRGAVEYRPAEFAGAGICRGRRADGARDLESLSQTMRGRRRCEG